MDYHFRSISLFTNIFIPFLAGVLVNYCCAPQYQSIPYFIGTIITIAMGLANSFLNIHSKYIVTSSIFLLSVMFFQLSQQMNDEYEGWPDDVFGKQIELLVKVEEISNWYFDASVAKSNKEKLRGTIRIKSPITKNKTKMDINEYVLATVVLKKPVWFHNPGSFNLGKYYKSQGIMAEAVAKKIVRLNIFEYTLRDKLKKIITNNTSGLKTAAIIQALIFGDKKGISWELKQVFINTGIAHLIAISGLHVSIVYVFTLYVLNKILRCSYKVSQFAGVLNASMYAYLAGFGYPTQRALLFLVVTIYLSRIGFGSSISQILIISFMTVVLYDFQAVYQYGFWMSFIAVWCISIISSSKDQKNVLFKFIYFQYMLFLFNFPVGYSGIGTPSYFLVLSNIYAVPLFSIVIIPLIFMGVVCIPVIENKMFIVADYLLSIFIRVQEYLNYTFSGFSFPQYTSENPFEIILVSILCVSLGLPGLAKIKVALAICIGLLFYGYTLDKIEIGEAAISVLDVGQGTSVVIETANNVIVYDVGTSKAGKEALLPFLRYRRINFIDHLIISHWDTDHSGGTEHLVNNFMIGMVTSHTKDIFVDNECSAINSFNLDGINFEYLSVDNKYKHSENNRSCLLKVSSKIESAIILGDADFKVEKALVQKYSDRLYSKYFIVSHHGSKNYNSNALLEHITPTYSLISAGYRNRYGHPHPYTLERLQSSGSNILSTIECGKISFKLYNKHKNEIVDCYKNKNLSQEPRK